MYDAIYREARNRIIAIARTLSDEQLETQVPACPEWTVRALLAHLTGAAHDAATKRLDGAPGDEWTARHVNERLPRPVEDNLVEWASFSDHLEKGLRTNTVHVSLVHDVAQHEADLRATLGLPRLPEETWRPLLSHIAKTAETNHKQPATLLIRADGNEWRLGSGDLVATVEADPFELWRAFFGRRSLDQIREWKWDRAPGQHLARISLFPARADALVEK